MKKIIDVKNLTRDYEYYKKEAGFRASLKSLFWRKKLVKHAVKKITFHINEGELIGFLGPNGSGKTTTLKMLCGAIHPTSGTATVLGFFPWERKREFQRQMSIVMGQKSQLWWDLPPKETFILNQKIYDIPKKEYDRMLCELVELLKLQEILTTPVRKLSLGERMKCELVAALLHNPRVLYLDEPTIGLDVVSQQNIREFLKIHNKEKKTTVMLTSHYMEDVQRLCERVIVIDNGEILYDGSLAKLLARYVQHKVIILTFLKNILRKDLEDFGFIKEFSSKRVVLEVSEDTYKKVATHALKHLPVDDILINEVSIEEVVRKIFQDSRISKNKTHDV